MRLLLIEDEKKLADFIARGLRAERLAVDVAYDGNTGWEMVCGTDYDLVVLDLMLPGINGTELRLRLRRRGGNAAVLVLTARDATSDKVENFEAGADDYLTKPFAFSEHLLAEAQKTYTLAEARYKVGSSSFVELSQAQLNAVSAEIGNAARATKPNCKSTFSGSKRSHWRRIPAS